MFYHRAQYGLFHHNSSYNHGSGLCTFLIAKLQCNNEFRGEKAFGSGLRRFGYHAPGRPDVQYGHCHDAARGLYRAAGPGPSQLSLPYYRNADRFYRFFRVVHSWDICLTGKEGDKQSQQNQQIIRPKQHRAGNSFLTDKYLATLIPLIVENKITMKTKSIKLSPLFFIFTIKSLTPRFINDEAISKTDQVMSFTK